MKLGRFEELVQEAFTHPNYKFKSWEACVEPANLAFDKMPPEHKAMVTRRWLKLLEQEERISSVDIDPDSFAFREELRKIKVYRFLAQTNLFFLCHLLEQYGDTTLATHEEICCDHFIRKDPTCHSFDEFADSYVGLKETLLLVPRNGFKSSIDVADSVQWALNYPEVTIAIVTGTTKLAIGFVGELKGHFTMDDSGAIDDDKKPIYIPKKIKNKKTREFSTSIFQVLFAEHCTKPGDGTQYSWQTPALVGTKDKEPTVKAAGLDQALAGWHHMVLKLDDCVNDENSQTVGRIESVNKDISVMEGVLNPNGFKDVIGTWYDENDYYGVKLKHEEITAKEEGLYNLIGSVDSGKLNSSAYSKVYLRACWWPTEEAEQLGKVEEEMGKDDYVLWFPERLNYKFLSGKKKLDPYFAIKYLNNPRKHHQVKFPRELLIRKTIPYNQLPRQGMIVSTVDTAYSIKNWADYTVMITALIYGGRFYIINMTRGRYNEFQLPEIIASTGFKWKPKRIIIEDSMGVKWMGRELRREMDKLRISIPVEFASLGYGSKANSKKMKAKPVVRLLGDDRMFFANSCEGLNDIYTELEKFTGTADDEHDDIVSALSLLAEHFGAYADMESKLDFSAQQYVADRQSQERYNQIYGVGRYAKYAEENPVTAYELQNAFSQEGSDDSYIDPMSDLLG